MMTQKAAWLFFDIGNVLLIDEEYNLALLTSLMDAAHRRGLDTCPCALMRERERLVAEEADPAPIDTLGTELLGAVGWREAKQAVKARFSTSWTDFNVPVPGCRQTLCALRDNDYHLGMAANQPGGCRPELERLGLLECFEVLGISEERETSKPDETFFAALLSEAGAAATEAVMIGDRIDNDIAPAQRLGFRTIHVQHPPQDWWFRQRTELADVYLTSLRAAPARGCGRGNFGLRANWVVSSLQQVTDVLAPDAST